MSYTLKELAEFIGADVVGADGCADNVEIFSLSTLGRAEKGQIAFLANSKYQQQLEQTNASAVILSHDSLPHCSTNALVMKNPYMGYALVAQKLDSTPAPAQNIHSSAIIDDTAVIGKNVSLSANVVVESGAIIQDNVKIGAGSFIGKNAQIKANTTIWSNVSIYHNVVIGESCLIHANTVIGADGFGYANDKGRWIKIPQLGAVIVGNNVEIGASTTIDRGALEDTIIEDGVILDNQIQIAHNVTVGENTAIAGCTVIAGSSTIGKNCIIGGLAAVSGHLTVADGTTFTGMTMVSKSIKEAGVYSSGMPCVPNREWHKTNARIKKLDTLTKRVKAIETNIGKVNTPID